MSSKERPDPPPLSIRLSQVAFDLAQEHCENIGKAKGAIFGIFCGFSLVHFRHSPVVLASVAALMLFSVWTMRQLWHRYQFFLNFKRATTAVAEEYDMYLRATNLGSIIKSTAQEIAADEFVKGRSLTDAEVDAIAERAYANTKARPEALQKLARAGQLIDEALEHWIGRYPNHTLQKILETLEAIRTAEERRTMRIAITEKTDA
jgi:hypothetical protein